MTLDFTEDCHVAFQHPDNGMEVAGYFDSEDGKLHLSPNPHEGYTAEEVAVIQKWCDRVNRIAFTNWREARQHLISRSIDPGDLT